MPLKLLSIRLFRERCRLRGGAGAAHDMKVLLLEGYTVLYCIYCTVLRYLQLLNNERVVSQTPLPNERDDIAPI